MEYINTPRRFEFPLSDRALLDELEALARRCWTAFDLHGYARVDFRVDSDGQPWILEVNANPCLSPDAGFAAALQQDGLSFTDAVERIIADAVRCSRIG
jgi:D-alanine-D-alanine ligase